MASFLNKNFSSDDDDDEDYMPSGHDKKDKLCEEVKEENLNLIEALKQEKSKKDAKKIFDEMKAESKEQLKTAVLKQSRIDCNKTDKVVSYEKLKTSTIQNLLDSKDTSKKVNIVSSSKSLSSNITKRKKEIIETITADEILEKNTVVGVKKAGPNLTKFINCIPEIPGMKTIPQSSQHKRKSGTVSLDSILNGKKSKMTTFAKSQQDWNKFKKDTGIEEELSSFTRSKNSYVEQQRFLERADLRQFEQEKNLRNKIRSKQM